MRENTGQQPDAYPELDESQVLEEHPDEHDRDATNPAEVPATDQT